MKIIALLFCLTASSLALAEDAARLETLGPIVAERRTFPLRVDRSLQHCIGNSYAMKCVDEQLPAQELESAAKTEHFKVEAFALPGLPAERFTGTVQSHATGYSITVVSDLHVNPLTEDMLSRAARHTVTKLGISEVSAVVYKVARP